MRFAQSRIGTIDTYAVFFILACSLGMLGFCRELARTASRAAPGRALRPLAQLLAVPQR